MPEESHGTNEPKTAPQLRQFTAGFAISAILINPVGQIKEEKDRKAWLPGFATAASYFEYFGKNALRAFFKSQRFGLNEQTGELLDDCKRYIERLSVNRVIDLLYWFGKITSTEYTKMCEVIKERNNIIHHTKGAGYQFKEKEQRRFRKLLEQSIECIRSLQRIRS